MKHGSLFNEDCRYCCQIEVITWFVLTLTLVIGEAVILLIFPISEIFMLALIMPQSFLVTYITRKWWRKYVPQSHGVYMDSIGDLSWHIEQEGRENERH